jgi:hypothetical protein
MAVRPQSFEHHAKFVFGYHRVLFGLIFLLLVWHVYRLFVDFTVDRVAMVALVVALAVAAIYGRIFALGVQDRVIRLEERLRMERLLPEDLRPRIPSFTTGQLIALRFASDAELPELARRVLTERLSDRKSIKAAIREWRADEQRV